MRYFIRSTACLAIISLQQCSLDKIAVATYLFSQPHSFLHFSKTFAIYGLLRASHSRNPTDIRIPGLRPPCSCPLTRSVRATSSARKLRFLAVRCTLINRKKASVLHASMGLCPFYPLRDIRIAPCFALPQSYGHSHSRPPASMLMSVNPFCEKAPLHASMRFAFHIRVISLIS